MWEFWNRKLIFLAAIGGAVLLVIIVLALLAWWGGNKNPRGVTLEESNELIIWTVGISEDVFAPISNNFGEYIWRDVEVQVQNFGSYIDYAEILTRNIDSDIRPDIIMVPNNDKARYFDPLTQKLSSSFFDVKTFENTFHELFSQELVVEGRCDSDGESAQYCYDLRGIPVGFETLGLFVNRTMIKGVPEVWSDLYEKRLAVYIANQTPGIWLGYWYGADVLPLRMLQSGYSDYEQLGTLEGNSVVQEYLSHRSGSNNMKSLYGRIEQWETDIDLFVQRKVGSIIGYPSTYEKIKESMVRNNASENNSWATVISVTRISPVPQNSADTQQPINLARYGYFSLSKNLRNTDNALAFMNYLMLESTQELFFDGLTYHLPATTQLLESKKNAILDGKMSVANFHTPEVQYKVFDKGFSHLFDDISTEVLNRENITAKQYANTVVGYINCKINHLIKNENFDRVCD